MTLGRLNDGVQIGKFGLTRQFLAAVEELLTVGERRLFVLLDRAGLLFEVFDGSPIGFVMPDLNRKVFAGQPIGPAICATFFIIC
jgi:hypothetical protein